MVGVSVLPREGQFIGGASLEKWDYCLRRLFVLKGQSLKAAIGYVRSLSSSMACEDYDVDVDLGPPLFFPSRVGRWLRVLKPFSNLSQTRIFHLRNAST